MESVSSKKYMGKYFYIKHNTEVNIYVKIAHAAAFRHQCEPQKQFADIGSLLEKWVIMFFCYQQLICQMLIKSWL